MIPAVVCRSVRKSFGASIALDGLDLEVGAGEIHGFLGPNGSGKTVTMRILLGMLRADSGEVEVFGNDPWQASVSLHSRMAYVPGDTNLWPNLTGGEILDVLGQLQGGVDPKRRAELIERFEFDPRKRARKYSKGNRQKVALIAAFSSPADLLVLDEPTAGLDPLMEEVFRSYLFAARDEGRSVLLSSHVLEEVEKTCDRVTIIRRGRTVQTGTLEQLREMSRTRITARVRQVAPDLRNAAWAHDLRIDGLRLEVDVDDSDLDEAVGALREMGLESLECHPPTLEELFLRQYREDPGPARSQENGAP